MRPYMLSFLIACSSSASSEQPPPAPVPIAPQPMLVPAQTPPASPDVWTTTLILFHNNDLEQCVEAHVEVPPHTQGTLSALGASMILAELVYGGAMSTSLVDWLTGLLSLQVDQNWSCDNPKDQDRAVCALTSTKDNIKTARKLTAQERAAMSDKLTTWPPKELETKVKAGDVAKVDACPQRVSLGKCEVTRSSSVVTWRVTDTHYDVATTTDSDAAMKTCLSLSGDWTAPAADDQAAALERARQHAAQGRRLLGQ